MSELRITDTNSANDSRGRALGFEGNDFVYVLVALVAALGLYLVLNVILRVRIAGAVALALPVFLGPFLWVVILRRNKPEGYAGDWFEQMTNGEGWSFVPRRQPVRLRKEAGE